MLISYRNIQFIIRGLCGCHTRDICGIIRNILYIVAMIRRICSGIIRNIVTTCMLESNHIA